MNIESQPISGVQKRGINCVTFGSVQRFNNNPSHQKIKPPFNIINRVVMNSDIEKLRYQVSRASHSLWNISANIATRSGWIWNCEQKT